MMARVQSDTGAVKFVLQGANIMCPGLTSPGADLPVEVPALPPLRRARPGGSEKPPRRSSCTVDAAAAAELLLSWCLIPFHLHWLA